MGLIDIFWKRNNSNPIEAEVMEQHQLIDQDLFVENEQPSGKPLIPVDKPASRLDKFFRIDHEWYGYADGYAYASTEFMEKKLKSIRSEFRLELDRSMDEIKSRISEARLHLIRVSGMPGRIEEEINEKIRQLESAFKELENQKVLSVDDEGMISSVIGRYTVGFTKGVSRYQQEKFIAGDTGLF